MAKLAKIFLPGVDDAAAKPAAKAPPPPPPKPRAEQILGKRSGSLSYSKTPSTTESQPQVMPKKGKR